MPITWEDPPPVRGSSNKYGSQLDELRSAPGKWGVIETTANPGSTAQAIRNGGVRGASPGEFECVSRGDKVYARYVGKAAS